MTSQFDLTRSYDALICNPVFQLGFLTREFQIPIICTEQSRTYIRHTHDNFKNVQHNSQIFQHFQQHATCKLSRGYNRNFLPSSFYSCYSCSMLLQIFFHILYFIRVIVNSLYWQKRQRKQFIWPLRNQYQPKFKFKSFM